MSRPITNWRPMMRIAWRKAVRTTGSPSRATRRRRNDTGSRTSSSDSRTSLPGQHQPPGRGVHEQRIGLAEVVGPLADRDLVGDQLVGRLGVGDAQQRLGEAHQHDALLRGEAVLLQERLDARLALAARPGGDHECDGVLPDRLALGVGQARERQQLRYDGLLVGEIAPLIARPGPTRTRRRRRGGIGGEGVLLIA